MRKNGKLLAALLCLLLLCALCLPALAEQVPYIYYTKNDKTNEITRHDGTCTTAIPLTGWEETLESGWYVAEKTLTYLGHLIVSGDVHLILEDGLSLTTSRNIEVNEGNSLSIYAQSEGEGMGALTVPEQGLSAGIGGEDNKSSGEITIHGGTVTVEAEKGAGIGGGQYGNGTVTIYGGTVTAETNLEGAGIGGGEQGDGTVKIYGGTVKAEAYYGAGIGGGMNGNGTVEIYGGTITAETSGVGAGIGGGYGYDSSNNVYGDGGDGEVTICGGTVTATANRDGAAIGGGSYGTGRVTISGGTVTATTTNTSAGIGGGWKGSGTIEISGGTVTAKSNAGGEAIGKGYEGSDGRVGIRDGMRVLAGPSESGAQAVTMDQRANACRRNKWAQVGVCPHDMGAAVTESGEYSCWACGYASPGSGIESLPIEIRTEADWNLLSSAIANGLLTGGKWFKLLDDISVTTMIGAKEKLFEGTFDGGGNTLTFTVTDHQEYTAPFSYVNNATICNLHVAGSITGSKDRASGLIGENYGDSTIENCHVSATLSGGKHIGGFCIGPGEGTLSITGCMYDGLINGTSQSGGFAGWGTNGLSITDCVFAPQEGSSIVGGTFYCADGGTPTLTNCYYLTPLGTAQGKQAHTVTAEPAVLLAFGEGETYPVSGITAFETGLSYRGTCLAAMGETVPLTLADMPDASIDSLTASAGTLAREGSGWKLTMPDEDVVLKNIRLRGTFRNPDFRLPSNVTSIGAHAFEGAKMTAVEVGGKCGSIGEAAFRNCGSLVKIRIPASVKTIDPTAFDGCGTVFVFGAAESAAKTYCDALERGNLVFVEEGKRGE